MRFGHTISFLTFALAGLMQSMFAWPVRYFRQWRWEHMWIAQSISASILFPLAWACLPPLSFWHAAAAIPRHTWLALLLWGFAWGMGGVAYGLALTGLGASFAYSFVLGTGMIAGALLPLFLGVVPRPANPSLFAIGLIICLLSIAGSAALRKGDLKSSMPIPIRVASSSRVLLLGAFAGVLSATYGLAFSFEFRSVEVLLKVGYSPMLSPIVLALPLYVGAAMFAIPYGLFCAVRSQSIHLFWSRHAVHNWSLSLLMGLFGTGGAFVYGAGSTLKPRPSPNVSFGIFMSFLVVGGNLIGMTEWQNSERSSAKQVLLGLSLTGLIAAAWLLHLS